MIAAEVAAWDARARASIRALWSVRHTCVGARERVHFWLRIIRLAEGHRYRKHPHKLTATEIGDAIAALLDQQTKDET
jgi:hypothetical protein